MLTRIITALIGIPFLLYIIISGGLTLKISMLVIAMIGVKEIYSAFEKQYKPLKIGGYTLALFLLISSLYFHEKVMMILGLFILGVLIEMVISYPKYTIIDVSATVFGAIYIALLFPFVSIVRDMPFGEFFVWIIFISAWGTDTFAYFTGYFVGKNKLAPLLSPKKTIEGAIGGVIGAALLGFVYTWTYGRYYNTQAMDYLLMVPVITAFSSVIAQVGDLSASSIKRFLDVKDFGHILPGHGGILDRFDSVLFAAPFVYVVLYLLF